MGRDGSLVKDYRDIEDGKESRIAVVRKEYRRQSAKRKRQSVREVGYLDP